MQELSYRSEAPHVLMARVYRDIDVGLPDECWPWTGATHNGYGQLNVSGKPIGAHRLTFLIAGGDVSPDRPHVLHSCDNPPCCNPRHLYAGDPRKNADDRVKRGRQNGPKGETHPSAKLTAARAAEIRARYSGSYGEKVALAREFGVSLTTIDSVVHRGRWNPGQSR